MLYFAQHKLPVKRIVVLNVWSGQRYDQVDGAMESHGACVLEE